MPGRGFLAILRLYSPLQPFFDKSWRAGEGGVPLVVESGQVGFHRRILGGGGDSLIHHHLLLAL